jgi:hypothetical protein
MMTRTPFRLSLAGAAALSLVLASAPPALAFPDAKIDQQIRPNFGGLITPPLKPRYRPDRPKGGKHVRKYRRPGGYGPGSDPGPGDGDLLQVAIVNCSAASAPGYSTTTSKAPASSSSDDYGADDAGGDDYGSSSRSSSGSGGGSDSGYAPSQTDADGNFTSIAAALDALEDNGTLYIRGGSPCRETVYVEHPVIIAGESASVFSGTSPAPATIAPAAGSACIVIGDGVKGVELRDLNFVTQQGGQKSCVQSWTSDVALVRTTVTYWGDGSAVFVSGGKLIMRDSVIEAKSWDPAVLVESATLDIARSKIAGEAIGLDLTPGNGESTLDQVGIVARGGETPGDVGLLVRGLRSGTGMLTIHNVAVCGWRTGLHLERGAQVNLSRSRVCDSQRGIISAGASLAVKESAIGAREIALYVSEGRASLSRSRLYGGGQAVFSERGAVVELKDNWVYSNSDCWRQQYEPGLYCVANQNLPGSLRDRGSWSSGYRRGWEEDAYDGSFDRDGAPYNLPAPQPPRGGIWGKKRGY